MKTQKTSTANTHTHTDGSTHTHADGTTHTHADGTGTTHTHADGSTHTHADGSTHTHADGTTHTHAGGTAHTHADGSTHTHADGSTHTHPHHHENTKTVLNRMNRAIGHMEAVRTMIEDGRDCSEVLVQIAAVRSAINNIGKIILEDHISHCLVDAVETGDEQVIRDLNDAIDKFVK